MALKDSSVEVFGRICDATSELVNEAQVVWSENFNAVSKQQAVIVDSPVVDSSPILAEPVIADEILAN